MFGGRDPEVGSAATPIVETPCKGWAQGAYKGGALRSPPSSSSILLQPMVCSLSFIIDFVGMVMKRVWSQHAECNQIHVRFRHCQHKKMGLPNPMRSA